MRRFLIPAIALGVSMLPLASGSASANMIGAPALASAAEPSAVSKIYWRNGRWIGPPWRRWGWRRPYWRRYGYWHRPYWRRYGYRRGRYWRG
jgi:hypothetical protein